MPAIPLAHAHGVSVELLVQLVEQAAGGGLSQMCWNRLSTVLGARKTPDEGVQKATIARCPTLDYRHSAGGSVEIERVPQQAGDRAGCSALMGWPSVL